MPLIGYFKNRLLGGENVLRVGGDLPGQPPVAVAGRIARARIAGHMARVIAPVIAASSPRRPAGRCWRAAGSTADTPPSSLPRSPAAPRPRRAGRNTPDRVISVRAGPWSRRSIAARSIDAAPATGWHQSRPRRSQVGSGGRSQSPGAGQGQAVFAHDVVVANSVPVAQLARSVRANFINVGGPHCAWCQCGIRDHGRRRCEGWHGGDSGYHNRLMDAAGAIPIGVTHRTRYVAYDPPPRP